MHLHWGSCDHVGSEHFLEGLQYPGEIHWVHALNHETAIINDDFNGELLVLGTFIDIGEEFNPTFEEFLDYCDVVKFTDSPETEEITTIDLFGLMSPNLNDYFSYHGSLTTPPCNETVYWFVFNEPLYVTKKQMQRLRTTLHPEEESNAKLRWEKGDFKKTEDNYRHIQTSLGRTVYRSFQHSPEKTDYTEKDIIDNKIDDIEEKKGCSDEDSEEEMCSIDDVQSIKIDRIKEDSQTYSGMDAEEE